MQSLRVQQFHHKQAVAINLGSALPGALHSHPQHVLPLLVFSNVIAAYCD
jgi:hypothetical protein